MEIQRGTIQNVRTRIKKENPKIRTTQSRQNREIFTRIFKKDSPQLQLDSKITANQKGIKPDL